MYSINVNQKLRNNVAHTRHTQAEVYHRDLEF